MIRWDIRLRGRIGALDVDLQFATESGTTVVIGPNGAGKSTLLRALAGAALGLTGSITLGDRVLQSDARGIMVPPEVRRIAYLPQGLALFPHLSVASNVSFGLPPGSHGVCQAWLERLGIDALAQRRPGTLSGGERQRVALARALAPKPEALLLDEPLAALDVGQRTSTRSLLAAHIADSDRPTLVVTHDHRDVAALGGSIVVIERGRVVQQGERAALVADPASDFVAEFFADA